MSRPLKYRSEEELQKAIDDYFNSNDRVTLAGLAVHLGIDRRTLYNYGEREDYGGIIKKARDRVEATYEERLIYESNPTGVIFALKNMNWKDKHETEHSGTLTVNRPKVLDDGYAGD